MYVWISPEGQLEFVWDDRLQGLLGLGRAQIRRASHVEPTPEGEWTADLGPSGGPMLGPFRLRQEALEAERRWLDAPTLGADVAPLTARRRDSGTPGTPRGLTAAPGRGIVD